MFKRLFLITIAIFLSYSASAEGLDTGDTAWMLTSTALVLFMTLPGLALFYAGLVRSKNAVSVLMQCFTIACLVSVVWVVYGYSLAFKGDGLFIGDLSAAFLSGIGRETLAGTIPESVFVTFQLTFAIITPALVVGAFAERMKFSAMCLFSALWLTFIYLPATHMVWGGGLLAQWGVIDFAGGLVVHLTCGVGALVAALVLGTRKGFPDTPMPPHNRNMVMMGAAMLWVGWFGFNGGSVLSADPELASLVFVTTCLAASTGILGALATSWLVQSKPDLSMVLNGMLAGLVGITAGADVVSVNSAMVIGLIAGGIVVGSVLAIDRAKLDDPVGAISVHLVCGIWGTLAVGIFSADHSFGTQLIGVLAYGAFTFPLALAIFYVIKATIGLRVSEEEERQGLDVSEHGMQAYGGM